MRLQCKHQNELVAHQPGLLFAEELTATCSTKLSKDNEGIFTILPSFTGSFLTVDVVSCSRTQCGHLR